MAVTNDIPFTQEELDSRFFEFCSYVLRNYEGAVCDACKTMRNKHDFVLMGRMGNRTRNICKDCKPTSGRANHLMSTYGITVEQFEDMLIEQGGLCGICHKDEPGYHGTWNIDHVHCVHERVFKKSDKPSYVCYRAECKPKDIRGLLCTKCNNGLGFFEDNPTSLRNAADWVEEHRRRKGE